MKELRTIGEAFMVHINEQQKEKLKTELQGSLYRYTLRNKGQRETVEFLLELAVNGPVPETVEADYATNVICNGRVWLYNHDYPYTIHQDSGRIFLDTREPRKVRESQWTGNAAKSA